MKLLKRVFIALLIVLSLNLYRSDAIFAGQSITEHPLEIRSTPEEEISTGKVEKPSTWIWLLAVGLIGGVVAVSSGDDEGGSDTGNVTYGW